MRLANKVAVVTGGTSGLGRSIAEALLFEGARVMCAARTESDMAAIEAVGGQRAAYTAVDVRDPDSVDRLMTATVERFGQLDVVVANAGVSCDGMIAKSSAADWDLVMGVNVTGVVTTARAALPYVSASRQGRVITLSSALSTRVAPGAAAYSCSKAAIDMFTRCSAVEFAEHGVTVNAIAPGFIDAGMGGRLRENDLAWDEYRPRLLSGRLGHAVEVGTAAVFLAGDDSSYVNGHVLEVNGGLQWN